MNIKPDLTPDSWQYRDLNTRAPSLSVLADTLIELAEQGHPVAAGAADLFPHRARP